MSNFLSLFVALLSGIALGVFYFGSLWITVRQLPTTGQPFRLFLGSFIGRLAVTLWGFYWVMSGHWQRALICLFGFWLARLILTQRWGLKSVPFDTLTDE